MPRDRRGKDLPYPGAPGTPGNIIYERKPSDRVYELYPNTNPIPDEQPRSTWEYRAPIQEYVAPDPTLVPADPTAAVATPDFLPGSISPLDAAIAAGVAAAMSAGLPTAPYPMEDEIQPAQPLPGYPPTLSEAEMQPAAPLPPVAPTLSKFAMRAAPARGRVTRGSKGSKKPKRAAFAMLARERITNQRGPGFRPI